MLSLENWINQSSFYYLIKVQHLVLFYVCVNACIYIHAYMGYECTMHICVYVRK